MHSWVVRLARRDLPIWAVPFWFRGVGLGNAIGRSNRISAGPIYALIGPSDDPKPYCVAIVGGIPRSGVGLRDENHFGTSDFRPAEAAGPSTRRLTRRAPPKRGIVRPSGGFGLLVDGALGDLGEGFISSLLFLKCLF